MQLTIDDKIQVNAFKSLFKCSDGTVEERFVRALEATSDDAFAARREADPEHFAMLRRQLMDLGRKGGVGVDDAY